MSRMKLLLDVVSDLRSLADSLQAVADAAVQGGPEQLGQNSEEKPDKKPEKKTAAKEAESPAKAPAPDAKPLTLEQVRAVLAEKSRAGHTAEVRALLLKHGADKLSEVNPAEYPALLADVEVL